MRSETLISNSRHISELLVPEFGHSTLLCRDRMPRTNGMAEYVRNRYWAFRQPKFECGCCEMLTFVVCDARQNFNVLGLYGNHDLDDRIYECLHP